MIDKYLDHLSQKISEQVKSLEENLGSGGAKNYDQYQCMCGQIKGLLTAQSEINDLKQRLEKSDE